MVRQFLIAAIGIAMLGGCGKPAGEGESSGSTTTTAEATPASGSKACEVLTQADAAKVLGREVNKLDARTSASAAAGHGICQYGYQGERMMDMGQASVTLVPVDLASLRKGVEEQGWKTEPVAGLGDAAFWSKEAGLYVGKGNRSAIYLVGAGGMEDTKTPAVALAQATAGRL